MTVSDTALWKESRIKGGGRGVVLLLISALFWTAAFAGCTLFRNETELSAEESYAKGMKEYDDADYQDAIPYFQKIIENYPFSLYAIQAELKIAESYYYDEKYVEALVHLQGFEELHPTNDQIPYVLWMKASSYFEEFSSIDRDVSSLENARRELEELQARFPGNPYREQADPLMAKVLQGLARHDFYVARFYYRDAEFQAALSRLYGILENYRGQDIADRATYYVGKCQFFLQNNEPALEAFQSLLQLYPDSKYVYHARMFVEDIQKGRFTVVSRYFRFKERVFGPLGYE
jgi:outer membrane protein assembly factor BamD